MAKLLETMPGVVTGTSGSRPCWWFVWLLSCLQLLHWLRTPPL